MIEVCPSCGGKSFAPNQFYGCRQCRACGDIYMFPKYKIEIEGVSDQLDAEYIKDQLNGNNHNDNHCGNSCVSNR